MDYEQSRKYREEFEEKVTLMSDYLEHIQCRRLGVDLAGFIQRYEARLQPVTDSWYMFVPTVLYMRSHMFTNKDMLHMDKPANIKKLAYIYNFALLVAFDLSNNDTISVQKLNILEYAQKNMVNVLDTMDDAEAKEISAVSNVWAARIKTKRFNQLLSRNAAHKISNYPKTSKETTQSL